MRLRYLRAHATQHLQTALACVYDHQLALECISDKVPDDLSELVVCVIMDHQLQRDLHLLAQHDWDFVAAELSWKAS